MSTISLPTSCLLDKSVVREALRGLVRERLGMPLPPRQGTALGVVRALIAYGGLLYITPELWHLLERPANLSIASPLLAYLRVLRPGRYLNRLRPRVDTTHLSQRRLPRMRPVKSIVNSRFPLRHLSRSPAAPAWVPWGASAS